MGGFDCGLIVIAGQPKHAWTCPCHLGYWDGVRQEFVTGQSVRQGKALARADYIAHLRQCLRCRTQAEKDNPQALSAEPSNSAIPLRDRVRSTAEPLLERKSSLSDQATRVLKTFFLPIEDIDPGIIEKYITIYLGPDASVKHFTRDGKAGYLITAQTALTIPMISELKLRSRDLRAESERRYPAESILHSTTVRDIEDAKETQIPRDRPDSKSVQDSRSTQDSRGAQDPGSTQNSTGTLFGSTPRSRPCPESSPTQLIVQEPESYTTFEKNAARASRDHRNLPGRPSSLHIYSHSNDIREASAPGYQQCQTIIWPAVPSNRHTQGGKQQHLDVDPQGKASPLQTQDMAPEGKNTAPDRSSARTGLPRTKYSQKDSGQGREMIASRRNAGHSRQDFLQDQCNPNSEWHPIIRDRPTENPPLRPMDWSTPTGTDSQSSTVEPQPNRPAPSRDQVIREVVQQLRDESCPSVTQQELDRLVDIRIEWYRSSR